MTVVCARSGSELQQNDGLHGVYTAGCVASSYGSLPTYRTSRVLRAAIKSFISFEAA